MKTLATALLAGMFLLQGCSEPPPNIDAKKYNNKGSMGDPKRPISKTPIEGT